MKYNALNREEKRVILERGTEAPFSGEYNDNYRDGVYLCRRCDHPLYSARDKFRSGCGWPSFEDGITGAVKRQPDLDGRRTEIICANCGGHLGHVFTGEKLTAKNTRHCVNSRSLRFIPASFDPGEKPYAVFGGGCFWCLDAVFSKTAGVAGVTAGYAGGEQADPTYAAVSRGDTGHAETVKIDYDPSLIGYEDLLGLFFRAHDPTTLNRQGNDIGEQYRSIILFAVWEQKQAAQAMIDKLARAGIYRNPIVTELRPLIRFYPAEDYHQKYFDKHPDEGYCQAVIRPKLEKLSK